MFQLKLCNRSTPNFLLFSTDILAITISIEVYLNENARHMNDSIIFFV